jgi:hypothetical protein
LSEEEEDEDEPIAMAVQQAFSDLSEEEDTRHSVGVGAHEAFSDLSDGQESDGGREYAMAVPHSGPFTAESFRAPLPRSWLTDATADTNDTDMSE